MIPFGKFLPDLYALGKNVAGDANGVIPSADGYIPWPQPTVVASALATACAGAIGARTSAGSISTFAGTVTKLYKYADASTWTDVSRASPAYNVATDKLWSFAQYGTRLIAANINDVLQYIDVDSGTAFDAVGGSPPQAAIVRTVGDFVMLGGLSSNFNRIIWSGRNNSDFWTPGTQDCDLQDFPDGGTVTGILPFGFGRGLIFQQGAIRAFTATNDRSIFNFQRIEDNRGLVAPDSLVTLGGIAYYLSAQGFFATDGNGASRSIGDNAVNLWFQGQISPDRIIAVRGAVDPARPRVFWLFPSAGNTATTLDLCLCYDVPTDAWSYAAVSGTVLFSGATAGYTIDNIDAYLTSLGYTLETVPFSFDSSFLLGGQPYLAIFDGNKKLAFFSGTPMAANVETADFQPVPSQRAFVRGCRPVVDTTDATVTLGAKEAAQGSVTFGSPASQNSSGMCSLRASGRWFRARMTIPAGSTWTHAEGVSFDEDNPDTSMIVPAGNR